MAAEEWTQVNIALFAQAEPRTAYVPWAELDAKLETWRAEACFERSFFMRKPPGIRLRFQGEHVVDRLEPALVGWLEDVENRNLIRAFRFATYEPEVFLFGGPVGMDIAHDQFDRESRLILRYEAMCDDSRTQLARGLFSVMLMNDLLARVVEDRAELWDVWQRVWHAHGRPTLVDSTPGEAAVSDTDRTLVDDGVSNNTHIAARLRAAGVARRLECGPRAWLAKICTFHWNRLGLSPEQRAVIMGQVLRDFDPHGLNT